MPRSSKIFISYDQDDAAFAKQLADDLKKLGARVWIAPDSVGAGESWVEAINRGLNESAYMVVVLTASAVGSKWVQKETEVAVALERQGRIRLIPLDVAPAEVPPLWGSYQMISFREDYDSGVRQLAGVLGLNVATLGKTRLPESLHFTNGKHCPGCGRDIGTLSIVRALLPNRINCPHCEIRIGYEIGYSVVITLMLLVLPLLVLGAVALWFEHLEIFMLALMVTFAVEWGWAAYLRNKKQLRVIRGRR